MDIGDLVFDWASGLPTWQQELVRRLATGPLAADRLDSTADFVAGAFGVGTPSDPIALRTEELGLTAPGSVAARLVRLGRLHGVGAVVSDQELTFAAEGLTIVYGANAAGKSSYVRVLKRACRSADQRSRIIPNVFVYAQGWAASRCR